MATRMRTLHMYRERPYIRITDSDKSTILYRVHRHSGTVFTNKPDMEIFRMEPSLGQEVCVGSVSHRGFSSKLDVMIANRPVVFRSNGLFSGERVYTSPRPGVGDVVWDKEALFSDTAVMVQQPKIMLARMETVAWARSKVRRLVVFGDPPVTLLDEIVVSAMAMFHVQEQRKKSSAAGAGGGGGGGGGGA